VVFDEHDDYDSEVMWESVMEEYNAEDEYVPCSICSCLIGDEVGYGDTWDGRWVCDQCAGNENET
jgi:hypothetical protein